MSRNHVLFVPIVGILRSLGNLSIHEVLFAPQSPLPLASGMKNM